MAYKLDKKDRKLLYELNIDSRQSYSKIAKKVGLSKQVVEYRLKNLIKNKVIQNFYCVINFSKLGYTQYKTLFKLQNVSPSKEKELVNFLLKLKNIAWIATCRGRWDLAITILAKDVNEFASIFKQFTGKYGKHILEKDILLVQFSPIYTKTYLLKEKEKQEKEKIEKKEIVYAQKPGHYALDKIDSKILYQLSKNARISIIELMQKTNLSRDTINYRMKKLRKDSIILGFSCLVNLEKINYKLYKIMFRLKELSVENENKLRAYCKFNPNIVQFIKLVGDYDIDIEVEVKDDEQFYQILTDMRNKFSNIIRDYDTLFIHKNFKLDFYPF